MPDTVAGHALGSPAFRRMLAALVCAGIATFAQLYSPQGVLEMISADLSIRAEHAALMVSAATLGLALAVVPWSFVGDRIGRLRAMVIAVLSATTLGLVAAWAPTFPVVLALRFLEGAALGGVPALAMAYLSEEMVPRARAMGAGWFVAGTTLGGLLGRLVATPVAEVFGWRVGMTVVAVLSAAAAAVFILAAPGERRFVPSARRRGTGPRMSAIGRTLRDPGLLVLLAFAFLMMGGFVAVYNYLTFHLSRPPYSLPGGLLGLVFLAYLGGTVASPLAGRLAAEHGRLPVMLGGMAVMVAGLLATLSGPLPLLLIGLVVMTGGFFGAHAVASGWAGARSAGAGSQATGLYNLAYYAGSSVLGWGIGVVYEERGWGATVAVVIGAVTLAAVLALVVLRREHEGGGSAGQVSTPG